VDGQRQKPESTKETAMKTTRLAIAVALFLALGAGSAVLAEDAPNPPKFKGEVIQVMQQTRTGAGNEGEFDSVMIRTRQGEQMRLVLGEAGSSQGQIRAGDQVRVRLSAGGPAEDGYRVQTMRVRRTGESFQHQPGTANSGANYRGGRGGGGGNSGGGGGRR
jgi:hypothetical protein